MKAHVKHVRISPKKASLVAGLVRGKKAVQAVDYLRFVPKKAASILEKLIASAIANAENNDAAAKDKLQIKSLYVTKGRILKRGIPASRGRVMPIKKYTSHIFVELEVEGSAKSTKKISTKKTAEAPTAEMPATEEETPPQKKSPAVKKTTAAKKTPAKKTSTK